MKKWIKMVPENSPKSQKWNFHIFKKWYKEEKIPYSVFLLMLQSSLLWKIILTRQFRLTTPVIKFLFSFSILRCFFPFFQHEFISFVVVVSLVPNPWALIVCFRIPFHIYVSKTQHRLTILLHIQICLGKKSHSLRLEERQLKS